jgi:hypothetical protein
MAKIIHKVNFLLEDDVCRELEDLVPLAKRNQVANEALRKELELLRRNQALATLSASADGKKFSTRKIDEQPAAASDNNMITT